MSFKKQTRLIHLFFAGVLAAALVLMAVAMITRKPASDRAGSGAKLPEDAVIRGLTDPDTRLVTARRAGDEKNADALPLLRLYARQDKDPEVRRMCVWAMGRIADAESLSALRLRLDDEASQPVRLAAVVALGQLDTPQAANVLVDFINDRDAAVAIKVIETLAGVTDPLATTAIAGQLAHSSKSEAVHLAAAKALASRGDLVSVEALARAVGNRSPAVRTMVVGALGKQKSGAISAAIAVALLDAEPAIRGKAREHVAKIGRGMIPHIARALAQPTDAARRADALEVLAESGGVETVPGLVLVVDRVRSGSAQQAGRLHDGVVAALAAMGPAVIEPLDKAAISARASLPAKRAAAAVCLKLGTPTVGPIVRAVTRWKFFPDEEELRLWVRTLGNLGDPGAVAALNRALAQNVDGMAKLVDEARVKIEAVSGKPLGPLKPDTGLTAAAVAGYEFPRKPTCDLSPAAPPVYVAGKLPADAAVELVLQGALIRMDGGERRTRNLTLHLNRRGGKWDSYVRGEARRFNQGNHRGLVARAKAGLAHALTVEMEIHDDQWVKGGFGVYDVELTCGTGGVTGSYSGRFNYRKVSGPVVVTLGPLSPVKGGLGWFRPGEHPRLIFRKDELPVMRARAMTKFGRAVIRAIQKKVADYGRSGDTRGGADIAIGAGFLYALLEDESYGRLAVPLAMRGVDHPHGGHAHDTAYKLTDVALAYDLIYNCLTDAERKKFTEHLALAAQLVHPQYGLLGNFNNGPVSNWTAIGCGGFGLATLATLGETGRIGIRPPKAPPKALALFPEKGLDALKNVPVNLFQPGKMLNRWLVCGPIDSKVNGDPLASIGGAAGARPGENAMVSFAGRTMKFLPLPGQFVRQAGGFSRKGARIVVPAAGEWSRSYFFSLLNVKGAEGGGALDCSFPVMFGSCRIWINGQGVPDGSIVILHPGLHRIMIEVVGQTVSPAILQARAHLYYGLYQRHLRMQARYEEQKRQFEQTGQVQDAPLRLEIVRRETVRWWLKSLGDHGWGTECGYEHAYGCLTPFTVAYETATGQSLVAGSGFGWLTPLEIISMHGIGLPMVKTSHLSDIIHLTVPEYLPAAVWEFNRRYLPDKLGEMSCRELAFAFVNYPLNVKPVHPEKILPKVLADTRKAGYVFRNHYDRGEDDIVSAIFFSGERRTGPAWFYPQAGTFHIQGLGVRWAAGAKQSKREANYAGENIVLIDGQGQCGYGKTLYFESRPNGSGIVGADMSDVYSSRGRLGRAEITGSRHFAVDYSGVSGVPALFAMVDRVRGGKAKTWLMHPGHAGKKQSKLAATTDGHTFTIKAPSGATLTGVFISPTSAKVSIGPVVAQIGKQIDYGTGRKKKKLVYVEKVLNDAAVRAAVSAPEAEFFVVWTIQHGGPPEIKVTGQGLDARVQVGGQEIRFKDGKLHLRKF